MEVCHQEKPKPNVEKKKKKSSKHNKHSKHS